MREAHVQELVEDFDKLESLFKESGIFNLGLASNVLNEYRYYARALIDTFKYRNDDLQYELAYARLQTAYSTALVDTVDNVHYYVRKGLATLQSDYPDFDVMGFLQAAGLWDGMDSIKWVETEISKSREDRGTRKAAYQAIAINENFRRIVSLGREIPKMLAAGPSSRQPDSWLRKILQGLEAGEFELAYQPKRHVADGKVFGAEALLRWRRGSSKINISPSLFIPKAEASGAIHMLGNYVIEQACTTLARWNKNPKLAALVLSINVSPIQFIDPGFSSNVLNALSKHGVDRDRLELEITEEVLIEDKDSVNRHLSMLRGVRLAVDDFGKGSTEIQYLADFAFNSIKVDRTLLLDALDFPEGDDLGRVSDETTAREENSYERLIRGIVGLSAGVNAEVVVEGVEDQTGMALLSRCGIRAYQGYFDNGTPVSLLDFEDRWAH